MRMKRILASENGLPTQEVVELGNNSLPKYAYLHQAPVSEKDSRSVVVTMRIGRQAEHYAIYSCCGYGNCETAFGVLPHLLHDTRAYVAMEIAVPKHVLVSMAILSIERGDAEEVGGV